MGKRRQHDKAPFERLLNISRQSAKSTQDLLDFALAEAIGLTRSSIGYIHFYNEKKRQFTLRAWSKDVIQTCRMMGTQIACDLAKTGFWGEAVRQAQPIVVNDFSAFNSLKKGFPQGHAPIERFISLPVFSEGTIVAVLGLANKKHDYTDADIQQSALMMAIVWQMVQRIRFEEALEQSQKMLDQEKMHVRHLLEQKEEGYRKCVNAENALRQNEEKYRSILKHNRLLFNNIPVPTFVWKIRSDQFILSEFNAAGFQFIGDRILDFVGKTTEQCFEHIPQITSDIRKCMELRQTVENQFWFDFDDRPETRYVIIKYAWAPGDRILMHLTDITGQKRAEENLHYISIHDSLTGVFNRFYADAEIARLATSRLRPVSVIVIDLNDMKKVNDKYGHAAGDLYIKNTAAILKQTFRPEDMIARVGGDEFLILLPLVDEEVCRQALARLVEKIEFFNTSAETPMSLSAGSATAQVGDNLQECIREADRRMYREKANQKAARGVHPHRDR